MFNKGHKNLLEVFLKVKVIDLVLVNFKQKRKKKKIMKIKNFTVQTS